jgi:molecular chaperone HscB
VDYFALLGLPVRYEVDRDALEANYLERSKQVHPDRFVNADAKQRVAALQQSMTLNQAYKTLRKPMSRAEYMLEAAGVNIGANEAVDPALLMEVLELREELADAKHAKNTSLLRKLGEQMEDRQDAAFGRVAVLFAKLEAGRDDALLADIKTELVVLRYINRYLDEIDDEDDDV